MEVTVKGTFSLKQYRHQLQDSAGNDFPQGVLTELLVLHDVCKCLDLNVFQAREVIGELGWQCIAQYINLPVCDSVNLERVKEVIGQSASS